MRDYYIYGALLTFSLALFGNTWSAGFAFDDNFAVVSNGDVTGSAPLAEIWRHDFWGQQIRSDQSHKSYRPVTILSLRLVNWAGKLLPNGVNWHSAEKHDNTGGLNAFPFHLANVVVHAINSCLVYRATLLLIALKAPCADLSLALQQHAHIDGQGKNKDSSHTHTQQHTLEACIAALLFAAHPIHTEAVAGIVGHAELLSAALALLALMAYMSAASKGDWGKHYSMLAVSMLMLFSAALAKEIGITMAGALVLIDVYMLPWPRLSSRSLRHHAAQLLCHRKVIRLVAVTAAVAAYAQLRSWLAGDHLVRIYRKVENPIPFAGPLTARLTTGFLHANWRTVTRNLDWEDEETLFVAAQKVCMNSGKVRLNSGILERRHSNWDQALHHFRRAREIDDTYCEPDYWIGASLLQQGKHVQLGLMELEKALRCKYVAANALNALQQVYQLMGSEVKEKAASHQAWARILLKPELGRVVEACQLLEQVALEKVQLGGSYASAQDAMKPCLVHLKQAQNASQQAAATPAPADAAFPKSDKPLLVTYTNSTLAQLMVCTKARGRVYRALSQHRPDSEELQDAVYKYLQRHMPSCRLLQAKEGHGEQQQVATVHLHLIHLVQSADSEDPWFQLEWGEIMALENRVKEASLHLQVAAALFITHLDQVPSVRKRGIANPKDAAQLAVMCLRRVQQRT
ncbi:hypothetical protein WJX82_003322 [Trebouxia sp. C0006]